MSVETRQLPAEQSPGPSRSKKAASPKRPGSADSKQIPNWFFMLMIVMLVGTTLTAAFFAIQAPDKLVPLGLSGITGSMCVLIGNLFRYKNLDQLYHHFVTTEDPEKRAAIKDLIEAQNVRRSCSKESHAKSSRRWVDH